MIHATDTELGRRIAVNYALRTAAHDQMMITGTCTPRISPLSQQWADLAALYDRLASESDALYAELNRREAAHA